MEASDRASDGRRPTGAHLPTVLEVGTDTSSNDNDSGSFNFSDASTSVRSSIYNFLVENGRSYHSYRAGKYFLPNDQSEQERLDLQHHSFKIYLNGKLNLAPLSQPKYVLDIGTGTGIWAIEFAQENPESQVIGSDLSPIQPDYVPPNCRFEIGDAEDKDWGFDRKFDYIHGRALVTCFKNGRGVVQNIYEHLEPGGWFELQDPCLPFRCDDGTMDGTALGEWNKHLYEGMLRIGKDLKENLSWGQYMREAGFVDVHETHAVCPFNTWPRGEKNKLLGAMSLQNMLEGVDSMSRAVFTRILGWDAQKLEDFLVDVKNDLQNKKIHTYCGVYFVYGRKPAASAAAAQDEAPTEPNILSEESPP